MNSLPFSSLRSFATVESLLLRRVDLHAEGMKARIPLARFGGPDDLKGAVVYLASAASSFVTGHTLVVDGGQTAW